MTIQPSGKGMVGWIPPPAQVPVAQGWHRRAIERILVNEGWKDAVVSGSYQVHQPAGPHRPDSGHLRVSVRVRI